MADYDRLKTRTSDCNNTSRTMYGANDEQCPLSILSAPEPGRWSAELAGSTSLVAIRWMNNWISQITLFLNILKKRWRTERVQAICGSSTPAKKKTSERRPSDTTFRDTSGYLSLMILSNWEPLQAFQSILNSFCSELAPSKEQTKNSSKTHSEWLIDATSRSSLLIGY